MGYTHYVYYERETIPKSNWDAFTTDVRKIIAAAEEKHGITVCREYNRSDEPPQIDDKHVIFNGVGENSHETFAVDRKPTDPYSRPEDDHVFAFCKTNRKPYDLVVTACMLAVKHHCPDHVHSISTDGRPQDWALPVIFCTQELGYGLEEAKSVGFSEHKLIEACKEQNPAFPILWARAQVLDSDAQVAA